MRTIPSRTPVSKPVSKPDGNSMEDLFGEIYEELHELADRCLRRERSGHTLQATALVHEAYVRLSADRTRDYQDLRHFRATAARVIRNVLIDHAIRVKADKRGGALRRVTLHDGEALGSGTSDELDLRVLDEALTKLAEVAARPARVVELRFFGGLSIAEIAEEIDCSKRTVDGDWAFARAWLGRKLASQAD